MSSKSNHSTMVSRSEDRKKKRELPSWVKGLASALIVLPALLLVLYASGAWQVQIENGKGVLDTWDSIISSFAFFAGFGALAIFHFSCKFYEAE